jgi:predicted dehydrogenase
VSTAGGPRILVVGAGSIGARHARNLSMAGASVVITDPDADRAAAVGTECGAEVVTLDLDRLGAVGSLDGAVVASPTSHHRDQAEALLAHAGRILVEKPIALDAASARPLLDHTDRVAVAYNLRFHEPIQRVVDLVDGGAAGTVNNIRLWFGSWLPDWRPAVDYRTTYSARAELGGGVLLDAIHELDLLVWLCGTGPHEVLGAAVDRSGLLDIDVEDTVDALVRTARGPLANIRLDYLARRYRRGIEVTGSEATIRIDWAREVIEIETAEELRREEYDVPLARSYELQAEAFVRWTTGGPALPVDAAAGAASVALADAIRATAR